MTIYRNLFSIALFLLSLGISVWLYHEFIALSGHNITGTAFSQAMSRTVDFFEERL